MSNTPIKFFKFGERKYAHIDRMRNNGIFDSVVACYLHVNGTYALSMKFHPVIGRYLKTQIVLGVHTNWVTFKILSAKNLIFGSSNIILGNFCHETEYKTICSLKRLNIFNYVHMYIWYSFCYIC